MQHLLLSIICPLGRQFLPMTHSSYQAICSKALVLVKEDSDGFLYRSRGYVRCELWRVLATHFHAGQIRALDAFEQFLGQEFAVITAMALELFFIATIWLVLCSPLLPSLRVDQKASCMALLQPLLFLRDTISLL